MCILLIWRKIENERERKNIFENGKRVSKFVNKLDKCNCWMFLNICREWNTVSFRSFGGIGLNSFGKSMAKVFFIPNRVPFWSNKDLAPERSMQVSNFYLYFNLVHFVEFFNLIIYFFEIFKIGLRLKCLIFILYLNIAIFNSFKILLRA